jgi:hypothetical protein
MNLVKPDSVTTTGSITRSTTGTYIDSAGVMQTAAINAVRVNHDSYTKEFLGLLIENASTNLLTYSQLFNNTSGWTNLGAVTLLSGFTAPDNTTTAFKATNTAGAVSLLQHINTTVTASTSNDYYASVFVKKGNTSSVTLNVYYDTQTEDNVTFNIDTKDVTGVPYGSEYIFERYSNDWYRVGFRITRNILGTSTSIIFRVWESSRGLGVVGNFTYVWGSQIEAGSKPTSYIPTVASQVTRAADIITGSGLVYTTLTESNPEWSSATTYALGAKVVYGIYGTYQSLQAGNLNHTPPITSPFNDAYWVRTGPTNKMAMFDDQISSVSSGTNDIIFAVVASAIDSVALLNITASKTNIAVTDKDTKVLAYHNSQQLSGGESLDWYGYFFYDADTQKTSSIYLDIPPAANSLITVKVSGTGTVSVGTYVNGQIKSLGGTQYGVSAGIIDYSRKETDEFGNTTFTKRNFSKRMNASVSLTNSNLNRVQRILYDLRATPVLWIASTDAQFEEPLIIYGFYRDFSTEISYPTHSICNLQVEGLI